MKKHKKWFPVSASLSVVIFAFMWGCAKEQSALTSSASVAPGAGSLKAELAHGKMQSYFDQTVNALSLFQAEILIPGLRNQISLLTANESERTLLEEEKNAALRVQLGLKDGQKAQLVGLAPIEMSADDGKIFKRKAEVLNRTLPFAGDQTHVMIRDFSFVTHIQTEADQKVKEIYAILEKNIRESAEIIAQDRLNKADPKVVQQLNADLASAEASASSKHKEKLQSDAVTRAGLDQDLRAAAAREFLLPAVIKLLKGNPQVYSVAVEAATLAKAHQQFQATAKAFSEFSQTLSKTKSDFAVALKNANLASAEIQDAMEGGNLKHDVEKFKAVASALQGKGGDPVASAAVDSFNRLKTSSVEMAEHATALANSANVFLDLAGAAGVDPSVIKAGKSLCTTVAAGSAAIKGFLSGGPLGAVAALSGSLGGIFGGGQDQASAEILGKLDELQEGQKKLMDMSREMIKLQQETLKMVSTLTEVIDLHQKELLSRLDLVDDSLSILDEKISGFMDKSFTMCNFLLYDENGHSGSRDNLELAFASAELLSDFSRLESRISARKSTYVDCIRGVEDVFISQKSTAFVASTTAGIDDQSNGDQKEGEIKRSVKVSLLKPIAKRYLEQRRLGGHSFTDWSMAYDLGLHLPSATMSVVQDKYRDSLLQRFNSIAQDQTYFSGNEKEDFLDVPKVIAQTSKLLALAPILSLGSNWNSANPTEMGSEEDQTKIRYALGSALQLVESSIAQEALLAGEPILGKIYQEKSNGLEQSKLVEEGKNCISKPETLGCLFRVDPYLEKNFVTYFVQQKMAKKQDRFYEQSIKNGGDQRRLDRSRYDLRAFEPAEAQSYRYIYPELAQGNDHAGRFKELVFGAEFLKDHLVVENGVPKMRIGEHLIAFPTPDEYEMDLIEYPSSMRKLVDLELALALAIEKMEPSRKPLGQDFRAYLKAKLLRFL